MTDDVSDLAIGTEVSYRAILHEKRTRVVVRPGHGHRGRAGAGA